ncbi:MAG: hypothetical protein B6D61_08165 [Bacteroidetes bacterium 4484_249]|nr:MAG: hypothetical protein B6D61_08165 [Bacteroidetes bacterium 4484_249]
MKKNQKYLVSLFLIIVFFVANAQNIQYLGRYIIRKENPLRYEFITEDFWLAFSLHQNVLDKYGSADVWEQIANLTLEFSVITGTYANIYFPTSGVNNS